METQTATQNGIPQPPKTGRGCLFYGCITLIVLTVLAVAGIVALGYFGMRMVKGMVNEYTEPNPMTLPVVKISSDDAQKTKLKVMTFKSAIERGEEPAPLTLTAQEINGLIGTEPDYQQLRGKVYVTIENDIVKGQISIPMADLGFPGRYLNGSAVFNIFTDESGLNIFINDFEVGGKRPPQAVMEQMKRQNMAANFENQPQNQKLVRAIKRIDVKDGAITIYASPAAVESGSA